MKMTVRAAGSRGQARRDLDQHRRSRRVVVGPVVNLPRAVGVEAAEAAEPEMIVVRPDDHRLVAQDRIPPGEQSDHVVSPGADDVCLLRHRRILGDGECLEPPVRRGLQSDLPKPAGKVRRGGVGAR